METYCPLNIDLGKKRCLVAGGGKVAERKVGYFLAYGAAVTVVSPALNPALKELYEKKQIDYIAGNYNPTLLAGSFLVAAATDDEDVNNIIAEDCKKRGILVNLAAGSSTSSFYLPAALKRGPLIFSVSTSGQSPAFANWLRNELELTYDHSYGEYACFLGKMRKRILRQVKDPQRRKALLQQIAGPEYYKSYLGSSRPIIENHIERLIEEHKALDFPGGEV